MNILHHWQTPLKGATKQWYSCWPCWPVFWPDPFWWVSNFLFWIFTTEPNFQIVSLTNHTSVFFVPKTYIRKEEWYTQIFSSKLIQFVVMTAYDEANWIRCVKSILQYTVTQESLNYFHVATCTQALNRYFIMLANVANEFVSKSEPRLKCLVNSSPFGCRTHSASMHTNVSGLHTLCTSHRLTLTMVWPL